MKRILLFASTVLWTLPLFGQNPAPSYYVAERGPHHATIHKVTVETTSYGKAYLKTNAYVQLATGMHYWEEDQWKASSERIEIINGAAIAQKGQHKVIFAANLNSVGAIDLLGPEGERLRSHVLGLAYTDLSTGESILFAEIKDCTGVVVGENQVYYQDAFDGDIIADVRYTYRLSGFEQDIIIVQAPPSPLQWNMDPETTRLEVWTEFIAAPSPRKSEVVLKRELDPLVRLALSEPDLIEEVLDFGSLMFPTGHAFPLGQSDPFAAGSVPTAKSWTRTREGRVFLIEKMDCLDILPHLNRLPQGAGLGPKTKPKAGAGAQKLLVRHFPAAPQGEAGVWPRQRLAQFIPRKNGYVLDYQTVNSTQTDFLFQGATTYYVTNIVTLTGTTTIEGGTVIKFDSYSPGKPFMQLAFTGPIDCQTNPWHPALLTAKDDDSVGETISGSSGVPSGRYGYYALACKDTSASYLWHDIHIRHPYYAVAMFSNSKGIFKNIQMGDVDRAFAFQFNVNLTNHNYLLHNATYGYYGLGSGQNIVGEHGTLHRVNNFLNSSSYQVMLTNTLLISVTNNMSYAGENIETNHNDSGIFETAAAGAYYLATNIYRDVGTTNINSELLQALASRTTRAPTLLTENLFVDTVLDRQVLRDDDTPDLGYHYDPLDYVARSITVSNAVLVLTNAATLGIDFDGTNYGILLDGGAAITSRGYADDLCRLVRIHAVQEGEPESGASHAMLADVYLANAGATIDLEFTELSLMGSSYFLKQERDRGYMASFKVRHSQVAGGCINLSPNLSNSVVSLTNSLFHRVVMDIYPYTPIDVDIWNCLFFVGQVSFANNITGSTWDVGDSLFDFTSLSQSPSLSVTGDYNGYVTNQNQWSPSGGNDIILTNTPVYLTGTLGNYYYPTNDGMLSTLIDQGSRNATNASLYHFTLTSDDLKEATSQVDIGYHYVATTNGVPMDYDDDGIPDYLEDQNGNGIQDTGETDWKSAMELQVWITRPKGKSLLP